MGFFKTLGDESTSISQMGLLGNPALIQLEQIFALLGAEPPKKFSCQMGKTPINVKLL